MKNKGLTYICLIVVLVLMPSVVACESIELPEESVHEETDYYTLKEPNIRVSGFPFVEDGSDKLTRIDASLEDYPEGVLKRADKTAGGRVIFKTDSSQIDIEIYLGEGETYPWFSLSGSAGVDVYMGSGKDKEWIGTYYPDTIEDKSISVNIENTDVVQQFTINLPLYSGVEDIQIRVDEGAVLYPTDPYTLEKPIVFYGSSITQGCSATRPGTSYPDIVTRYFDANLVNLGFSSSAKGEKSMAEMIAKINMSALIMEYDHNAETPGNLAATHEEFYRIIRDAHPDIPIVFISRLSGGISVSEEEAALRRRIVGNTYKRAVSNGDNVYFIDGNELLPADTKDDYFVDGVHPNDRGMAVMAEAVITCLEKDMDK